MIAFVALAVQRLCMRLNLLPDRLAVRARQWTPPAANVREAKLPAFGIDFNFARIFARHPREKS
jgi:hypothetical protein